MQGEDIQHIKRQFGIIGNAPSLNRVVEIAAQVAPTAMTVLITGESGSGKESFSKLIHRLSPNKHGNFIALNCGAIPEGTIDSELFGHKKGAFTGANEDRKGYFEEAAGGTIFLDEVGELPLGTQARLLRILEYGEFIRVGSSKVQKISLRIVSATNVDLLDAVQKGKFREDLYYRLNTVPLRIPPLRERGMDIEILFRKFATDFSDQYHVKPIQLTEEAQNVLLSYQFPGNIRQLKNIVEQLSALEVNRVVNEAVLQQYLPVMPTKLPALYGGKSDSLQERELLYKVLFDMKRDMGELKRLVFDLLNQDDASTQLIQDNEMLFQSLQAEVSPMKDIKILPSPTSSKTVHDEMKVAEEESLSIEQKEKELIGKALRKHQNNRKGAARDLGISERTLYRKIKQYEMDS